MFTRILDYSKGRGKPICTKRYTFLVQTKKRRYDAQNSGNGNQISIPDDSVSCRLGSKYGRRTASTIDHRNEGHNQEKPSWVRFPANTVP